MLDLKHQPDRKKFYNSSRWKKARAYVLTANPLCKFCLDEGVVEPAIDVDHIIDLKKRPDLALSLPNLQGLCKRHHSEKSAKEIFGPESIYISRSDKKWKELIK